MQAGTMCKRRLVFLCLESRNVGLAHSQLPRELGLRELLLRSIDSDMLGYRVGETSSIQLRQVLWIAITHLHPLRYCS
jgi:hypothetical protein